MYVSILFVHWIVLLLFPLFSRLISTFSMLFPIFVLFGVIIRLIDVGFAEKVCLVGKPAIITKQA